MLNAASPIPLYQQLAELLRQSIDAGEFSVNEKIPSELELAQVYGIGRPTVRQATDMLVHESALERRRGSGTYVLPKAKHVDLFSLSGTGSAWQASDVKTSIEWLVLPELVEGQHSIHGLPSAYRLQRITRVDGPVLLETFYLHGELFAKFDARFDPDKSLSAQVKQHYHLSASSAEQSFQVLFPSRKLAKLMQVSNKVPLLHVSRTLHFGPVAGAIYCDIICRTDRYHFSQTINAK